MFGRVFPLARLISAQTPALGVGWGRGGEVLELRSPASSYRNTELKPLRDHCGNLTSRLQALCTPPKPLWYLGDLSSIGKSPSPASRAGSSLSIVAYFPELPLWRRRDFLPEGAHVLPPIPTCVQGKFLAVVRSWGHW